MKKIIVLGFGLLFFAGGAQAIDVGVGAKAGINGVGLDLSFGLTKDLNLRLSGTSLDIQGQDETVTVGDAGSEGDIDAKLDFDYGASAVFLDWHVLGGGFRLTAGMYKNNGAAKLSGVLQNDIVIDGQPLDTTDLVDAKLGGEVSLGDSYQPYLGIGWGRGAGGGGGFSFSADLGVAIVDPSVDFTATVNAGGNFANQAELDATLRDLEKDAEKELNDLELWPVLAIGVNYAF